LLIGLSIPFLKFIKKLSPWYMEKKFGFWPSALQLEKLVSLGLLIYSTNTADTKTLKQSIMEHIQDI